MATGVRRLKGRGSKREAICCHPRAMRFVLPPPPRASSGRSCDGDHIRVFMALLPVLVLSLVSQAFQFPLRFPVGQCRRVYVGLLSLLNTGDIWSVHQVCGDSATTRSAWPLLFSVQGFGGSTRGYERIWWGALRCVGGWVRTASNSTSESYEGTPILVAALLPRVSIGGQAGRVGRGTEGAGGGAQGGVQAGGEGAVVWV